MKKILFLVVALLSIVSAKLYSSNQELVFEEPPVMEDSVGPPGGDGECAYIQGSAECVLAPWNNCGNSKEGRCDHNIPQ